MEWSGSGVDEVGTDVRTGEAIIAIDPRYFRPTEVEQLQGDASKARRVLGWSHTVTFPELVREMVDADLSAMRSKSSGRAFNE